MKIMFWSTLYLPHIGGLEVMTHHLIQQLKKMQITVQVISNNIKSDDFERQWFDGVEVHTFPFSRALMNHDVALIKKIIFAVNALVAHFSPDVVSVHGWYECFSFYQVRVFENKNIPICVTIHGLLEQSHYRTAACLKLWSMAAQINTVSYALIGALSAAGFSHAALQVIYNGLPRSKNKIVAAPANNPVLLMIGRLSVEKCFDVAFYALKKLIHRHPFIRLIVVGGGTEFGFLATLKKTLGLDALIEMTDFVPPNRIGDYIDRANVIVVPSYYESFSLVALEAAMHGRPVIASNVYGLKEVVLSGETGILVEPHQPDQLAAAIDQLLSDAGKMKQMGIAARQRADSFFSIEKTAQQYLMMFKKAVSEKHATVSECYYSSP